MIVLADKSYRLAIETAIEEKRYEVACELLKNCLVKSWQERNIDHWMVARANELAAIYTEQANYAGAVSLYRTVLLVRQEVLGEDHPDALDSLSNLRSVMSATGWAKPDILSNLQMGR